MPEEKLVGVVIDPSPLKAKVPRPIELNKLIVDDFRGDGGAKEVLENRRSQDYAPPEPFRAPTLGDAFAHFRPSPTVEIPSIDNPGEQKRYTIPHTEMSHFDPGSYEKRIPELRRLEESRQGLGRFLDWLMTKEGEDGIEDLLSDEKLSKDLEGLRNDFEGYLRRIERVLEAE